MHNPEIPKQNAKRPLTARPEYWGYIFIAPWLIGLLVFTLGPMLVSLYLSFCSYNLRQIHFIGLGNYHRMFVGSEQGMFFKSLTNTALYVLLSVPMGLTGSVLIAILLNQKVRGVTAYRTLYYLPSVVPAVASALVWRWVLDPQMGILNVSLTTRIWPWITHTAQGWVFTLIPTIKTAPNWLGSTKWALPSFVLMSLWGIGGQRMIIFLAGLQGISDEYYEAAKIDGAGMWNQFRHVTIPLLTPTIFFNMVLGVIGAFQVFTSVFVLTSGQGGPDNATLFYVLYLYRNAFEQFHLGYACTLAWILFVLLFSFTLIQFKNSTKWVYYEGDDQ